MNQDKFRVDFLGIGVEKGGSTWLGRCIGEHPEVCFPKDKEIYFFNDVDAHYLKFITTKYTRGIDWYKSQFKSCGKEKKIGEWAITYICTAKTAERIKKHLPKVKMIACLRNPINRTFSQYLYEIRMGLIDKKYSFEEVLKKRPDYMEKGLYAKQLENYYKFFNKDQILVLIYEEVKENPERYIRKVWRFLGLKNCEFIPPSLNKKINTAGEAFLPKLNYIMISSEYFLRGNGFDFVLRFMEKLGIRRLALNIRDLNNKRYSLYPKMSKKTRENLSSLFKNDTKKLEKLLRKDLSIWRS